MNINTVSTPVAPKFEDRAGSAVDSAAPVQAAANKRLDAAAASGEAQPSREQVADAVKKINQSLPASAQGLEFSVDDDNKQTIVKIVDISTREVVRQIPTVEALEIAKSLDKMMGRLISDKV